MRHKYIVCFISSDAALHLIICVPTTSSCSRVSRRDGSANVRLGMPRWNVGLHGIGIGLSGCGCSIIVYCFGSFCGYYGVSLQAHTTPTLSALVQIEPIIMHKTASWCVVHLINLSLPCTSFFHSAGSFFGIVCFCNSKTKEFMLLDC